MASHVLHRFLVPRHPPCALKNLATDARVHCAVLKQRPATHHPHTNSAGFTGAGTEDPTIRPCPQDPTTCPTRRTHRTHTLHAPKGCSTSGVRRSCVPNSQRSTHEQTTVRHALTQWPSAWPWPGEVLLRKEVIQPHLPVRLPCYDFVPIAGPTFDSSLPQGVGPPASGVTDFRDVTGGVYKARERIHRSNADLRLLATPTSWGRVADPNPN